MRIGIGHPQGGEFQWVEAWVDTGATHSMIPASLLEQVLHLSPTRKLLFELDDGREQHYGFGQALFKIEDDEMTCPVIFGPEDQYLLGATTLRSFNVIPDTTPHPLVPTPRLRI